MSPAKPIAAAAVRHTLIIEGGASRGEQAQRRQRPRAAVRHHARDAAAGPFNLSHIHFATVETVQ